ncbi:MAG: glycosyltransferase [Treponema sp.]|nr:glycosyltransferase [Treponema sp.]
MIVLYITYVNSDEIFSGSGVRPAKMLNAFKQEGHEVIVLQGEQVSKERLSNIKKIRKQIKRKRPDLCYIESPTYPIMRHADRKLIKDICKAGIPTGYFYRDFYWQFPKEFPRRTSISGKIKDKVLLFLQSLTNKVLKYCNIIYVPSDECKTLLKYHDIRALPPAGENHLEIMPNRINNHTGIYVGGISGYYNVRFLLDVFCELNRRGSEYILILVCRENEWKDFEHPCKNAPWLEVHHTSGNGLVELYKRASVAFNVGSSSYKYSRFAISVKVFEYLSFGLPQVVINNKAIADLVNSEKIGIAVEGEIKKYTDATEKLMNDNVLYSDIQKAIRESLLERNLWIHRVRQIVRELSSNKNE